MKLTKKCPYCGTVMPMGARQCMYCGQMQPDNDATQYQSGNNESTQYQSGTNDATQYQGGANDSTQYQGGVSDSTKYQGGVNDSTQYQGGAYPPPVPPARNGSNNNLLYILLAALLLVGLGVGAYFLFNDKGDSTTSTTTHDVITGTDTRDDDEGKDDVREIRDEEIEPIKDVTPVEEPVKEVSEPVTPPAPPVETTKYYNYSGNITYKSNVYYFKMNLTVKGNNVNGDYIVTNGENVWVTLSGTMDKSGKAIIREYKGGSPTTYYFDGYLNSSSFSGKYKTTSRPLVMDFYASAY